MYTALPPPKNNPPRRLAQISLPAYRFVPGLHPHPTKDPRGHSFARSEFEEVSETGSWTTATDWLFGLDLFDFRFYWEAHEVWEARWKLLEGDDKAFLQGMILSSACLLQRHMGRKQIAAKSWRRAKELLNPALRNDQWRGIELVQFIQCMDLELPRGGWPVIENCPK